MLFKLPHVIKNKFDDQRYQLTMLLGEGGMAEVYVAEVVTTAEGADDAPRRLVAVKILKPRRGDSGSQSFERFRREGLLLAQVQHPHVLPILDIGLAEDDTPFYVMPYEQGMVSLGTLRESVAARLTSMDRDASGKLWRPLFPREVLVQIFRQLLAGLAAIHTKGIVHRDIKPENIFLVWRNGEPHAYIGDLGIAMIVEPDAIPGVGDTKLTWEGAQIGTPEYMAPEQTSTFIDAQGQAWDVHAYTDIWALGVMWFELLTGRLPFAQEGLALAYLFHQIRSLSVAVPELAQHLHNVDPRDHAFVRACLQKKPWERKDATALLALLTDVEKSAPISTVWGRLSPRTVACTIILIVLLFIIVILVGIILGIMRQLHSYKPLADKMIATASTSVNVAPSVTSDVPMMRASATILPSATASALSAVPSIAPSASVIASASTKQVDSRAGLLLTLGRTKRGSKDDAGACQHFKTYKGLGGALTGDDLTFFERRCVK